MRQTKGLRDANAGQGPQSWTEQYTSKPKSRAGRSGLAVELRLRRWLERRRLSKDTFVGMDV